MILNAHSYYSLRYGTLSPTAVVEKAAAAGHRVLALTDINNTSGHLEFVRACQEHGITPLTGIEFRNGDRLCYIGLPRDQEGVRELNEHLSEHELSHTPFSQEPPLFEHSEFIIPFRPGTEAQYPPNSWIGIRPEDLRWHAQARIGRLKERCVTLHPLSFADEEGRAVHRLLRAIDHNSNFHSLGQEQQASPSERLRAPDGIRAIYGNFPQLLRNTEKLLQLCTHTDVEQRPRNRRTYTGSEAEDREMLERLALEGFQERYRPNDRKARQRLRDELNMIGQLRLAAYFLITLDIVRYADRQGYQHVGRGSGANSIVAYCLHITEVDPVELNLYFERFINPERSSPPDFDIDFSWDERDDVTRYVLERFGREHTALLCTFDTFKQRSAVREIAKVHGLPDHEIDALTNPLTPSERVDPEFAKRIHTQAAYISGFPNHLGIHAGGILISEEPLAYSTALSRPPKGFPLAHIDMHVAEDMGYHKFDILSQRGIGHIKEAAGLVEKNRGEKPDLEDGKRIRQDPAVREELRNGRCTGCFYIESPAMRGLLQKLRCDDYPSLVAASSIIRPGVAKSGMMREYIRRSHDPESYEAVHPVLGEVLKDTYGVMVYQEDVLKVLHHFAGLEMSEADVLRKLMSGKSRGRHSMEELERKFFDNCRELGRDMEAAKEVWRQVESFAGYAFAKGHSASYAVESFQSLYLKTHYPLEFYTAVINNAGGFFRSEVYVRMARMHGARVHAPCINESRILSALKGEELYLGLGLVGGLERKLARRIVEERDANGSYGSMAELTERVPLEREQLELLIRVGALRSTEVSRKELLWEKHSCLQGVSAPAPHPKLLDSLPEDLKLPELDESEQEAAFEELEILGFPLCSPFDLLKTRHRGDVFAKDLTAHAGRTVRIMGYFVNLKPVRTVNGKRMGFATWMDPEGTFFDSTHFPGVYQRDPFRGIGCYLLRGKVDLDFGHPSLEVERMAKLPFIDDPRVGG